MVLQRDRPNTFWGWTTPGTKVAVTIDNKKAEGTAAADGKWTVRIVPPKVGGPYRVSIDGDQQLELDDVLVGDVWLCTGQSNMEFGLSLENGGAQETANANDPNLRLFIAPHQDRLEPQSTNGGTWKVCTPQSVAQEGWGGFSAVGYHFGKALRREVGVPIGLVEVVWGGTNAESWISWEALRPLKDFDAVLPRIDAAKATQPQDDQGIAVGYPKPEFDASSWKPLTALSAFHALGLDQFDGTVWLRKEFSLTSEQAAQAAVLTLGAIDDNDVTFLNGAQIGTTSGYSVPRSYAVAPGSLKEGRNVLVVKMIDTGDFGGFSGPVDALTLTMADGTKQPLLDGWTGIKGAGLPVSDPNMPTSLYNGMIAPVLPLGIKGAIWYQGENNAGRAVQYRRILPAMIGDWRSRFGQGDFPFYIVSLAAFQPHRDAPGDDAWAELREAQAMTAGGVRNSGLAMAIDVGDTVDIHPKEKKTVGERLALIALAKDYGKSVVYQGPTYRSLQVKGGEARVTFAHTEGGLLPRGGPLGEFALAGADRKWHWAVARIEGDVVVLSSPDVSKPVAVRYAWQANPVATLTNGAGLPAVPFRTDDWPEITAGSR